MQKITPFLWFNDNAEEAVHFYIDVFKDGRVLNLSRYGEEGPGASGGVMTIAFELHGQRFIALNGGPRFAFTEAVSFVVNSDTQEEIDRLWDLLSAGGEQQMCGWLKDRFGLSWQIIPPVLGTLMSDKDPAKAKRVMHAMLQMKKIDIGKLREAHAGKQPASA